MLAAQSASVVVSRLPRVSLGLSTLIHIYSPIPTMLSRDKSRCITFYLSSMHHRSVVTIIAACQNWCYSKPVQWTERCSRSQKCSGCPECSGERVSGMFAKRTRSSIGEPSRLQWLYVLKYPVETIWSFESGICVSYHRIHVSETDSTQNAVTAMASITSSITTKQGGLYM